MKERQARASRIIQVFEQVLIFAPFILGPIAATVCLLASLAAVPHLFVNVSSSVWFCMATHNIVRAKVVHSIRSSRTDNLLV